MSELLQEVEGHSDRTEGDDIAQQGSLRWIQALRRHPWIVAFNLMCLAIGLFLALEHLPTGWSLVRRLAAGALSGIGIGLMITANRMLGAWR
jgi:hypothetical protein